MSDSKVSIVVCTYNRCDILELCLQNIEMALVPSICEVLVIDNNSTDQTKEICAKYAFVRRVLESQQGLSHARNKGAQQSKGNWIFYIDDDMFLHQNSLLHLTNTITTANDTVGIIGGTYDGHFLKERPGWLTESFVSFKPSSEATFMNDMFVHGGIFCIKKSIFHEVGFFNTKLGMTGKKMGYGEEEEFQYRCRDKGYKIFFNPKISGSHLVGEHKYSWKWYVASAFQLERDIVLSQRYKNQSAIKLLLKHFLLIGYNLAYFVKNNFKKLSAIHLVLFFSREIARYLGLISGIYQRTFSRN